MRTFAIWTFGLLAALIIGAFLGSIYDNIYNKYEGGIGFLAGAIAGMCIFACLRLWLAPKPK